MMMRKRMLTLESINYLRKTKVFRLFYPRNTYYIVKSFFSCIFLKKQQYDVIFYYPQHFNGLQGEPPYFLFLLDVCKKYGFKYLLLEEPDYLTNKPRNKEALPLDFIWLLVLVLRKLFYPSLSFIDKEHKIGRLLNFFWQIKSRNIITISQSFQGIFRGLYPNSKLFDYQHGVLSKEFVSYHQDGAVAPQILKNKVDVLLFGKQVKEMLSNVKGGEYFKKNSHVLGIDSNFINTHSLFNKSILLSLQISISHTRAENEIFLNSTYQLLQDLNGKGYTVYIKEHPRFNNCIDISSFYQFNFVKLTTQSIQECLTFCSLHLTEYSTSVFEAIDQGVPTILTQFNPRFGILLDEYHFPQNKLDVLQQIEELKDVEKYQKTIKVQSDWAKGYYEPFNEELFVNLIR